MTITPDDTPSPIPIAAEELAKVLADEMEAIVNRIGGVEWPHRMTAGRVRGARTVPRAFVTSMIVSVSQLPDIEQLGTFDMDEALAMLQFNDAFRIFGTRMEMLLTAIR